MSLKFNLLPIPESEITKVDQLGEPVPGAKFALYAADEKYNSIGEEPLWTGTTDDDGKLRIWDKETDSPIAFKELVDENNTTHFVLRETETPEGYRNLGDVHLYYEENSGLILSYNYQQR